jgi:hypothetical protein
MPRFGMVFATFSIFVCNIPTFIDLKYQSSKLQSYEKWYIRKDHEKWSIFCFYGMFW